MDVVSTAIVVAGEAVDETLLLRLRLEDREDQVLLPQVRRRFDVELPGDRCELVDLGGGGVLGDPDVLLPGDVAARAGAAAAASVAADASATETSSIRTRFIATTRSDRAEDTEHDFFVLGFVTNITHRNAPAGPCSQTPRRACSYHEQSGL